MSSLLQVLAVSSDNLKSTLKKSLQTSRLGSMFLEEYSCLKKFRSSLRISFGSLILIPLLFIKEDMCFHLRFNFSKLRKYLLFFSPCSYQRALLLVIAPRILSVANSDSVILICSSSALSSLLYAVWSLALTWANLDDMGCYGVFLQLIENPEWLPLPCPSRQLRFPTLSRRFWTFCSSADPRECSSLYLSFPGSLSEICKCQARLGFFCLRHFLSALRAVSVLLAAYFYGGPGHIRFLWAMWQLRHSLESFFHNIGFFVLVELSFLLMFE